MTGFEIILRISVLEILENFTPKPTGSIKKRRPTATSTKNAVPELVKKKSHVSVLASKPAVSNKQTEKPDELSPVFQLFLKTKKNVEEREKKNKEEGESNKSNDDVITGPGTKNQINLVEHSNKK